MAAAEAVELFRCERLGARLKRSSCAARYELVNGSAARSNDAAGRASRAAASSVERGPCAGCPVGAAHAAGRSPRVMREQVVPLLSPPEQPREQVVVLRAPSPPRRSVPAAPAPSPVVRSDKLVPGRRKPLVQPESARAAARHRAKVAAGTCTECSAPAAPGRRMCLRHADAARTYNQASRRRRGVRPKERLVTYAGTTRSVTEWARHLGLSTTAVRYRLARWPAARALGAASKKPGHPVLLSCKRGHPQGPGSRYAGGNCVECCRERYREKRGG